MKVSEIIQDYNQLLTTIEYLSRELKENTENFTFDCFPMFCKKADELQKLVNEFQVFIDEEVSIVTSKTNSYDLSEDDEKALSDIIEKENKEISSIKENLSTWMMVLWYDAFNRTDKTMISSDEFDEEGKYEYIDAEICGIPFNVHTFCNIVRMLVKINPNSTPNELWDGQKSAFTYKNQIFEAEYFYGQGSEYTLRILEPNEDIPAVVANFDKLFIKMVKEKKVGKIND